MPGFDGILVISGNQAVLLDMAGKQTNKCSVPANMRIVIGSTISLMRFEIELDRELDEKRCIPCIPCIMVTEN